VPGLGAHKRSHPDLKLLTKLEMSSPDLSAVRVQYLTMLETSSPDLSAVRVQHVTWAEMFNANPKVVRVPLRLCGEDCCILPLLLPFLATFCMTGCLYDILSPD